MKLKKTLLVFALTILGAITTFGFASCDSSHEHSFSGWDTIAEPTCTAFGLRKRACECGYMEYDTVDALSHTPVTDEAVGATCTTPGKTEGSHCKDCGVVIVAQTETEKLSHSFSGWDTVAEPTCTSFGLRKRACDCGYTEYDTVDALSHTPVIDEAVDATCTTLGKTEGSHCKDCGTILVAQNPIASLGHNCNQITVLEEALCNLEGKKKFSCSNPGCSYYYEENYALEALNPAEIYAAASQYTGIIRTFSHLGGLLEQTSAFLISADGKIVTNALIMDDAFSALFELNGEYYDVTEVLAYNTETHLAVLKIDVTDFPYATLCMREPANAETVYVFGAPSGYANSMSSGIISNAKRLAFGRCYIEHDAYMTNGHLGGPLLNRFGEVIGVNIGFIGDDNLNVSTWIAELDNLDYSNPMSMAEYGNLTFEPLEQLNYWVATNQNAYQGDKVAYVFQGSNFYYSLAYDTVTGYSLIEGYWEKSAEYQLYTLITFNNTNGTYQYYATLKNGTRQNEANGFLDAATYTKSTILTYDTFYGKYWAEAELMNLYSTAVYDTLGWFSYCLDTYFDNLTLETFGFSELSYDRDEEALGKLNDFVAENGTLNSENGSYILSTSKQVNSDTVVLDIVYTPATEDSLASTILTAHYYTADGELYVVSITLNPVEEGNRFDVLYAIYNETEYVVQNSGWGYLDANTLTIKSELYCYEFFGMNEYEDALLADYASLLSYIMGLTNELLHEVDPALTIKDLGFLFYFG